MATKYKSTTTPRSDIYSHYMTYAVATPDDQRDIFSFCKEYKINENDFFSHYDTFIEIESDIWKELMLASLQTIKTDANYVGFSEEEKLLSLFYTLFENLTLNRDYVNINLGDRNCLKSRLTLLKSAKETYIRYIEELWSGSKMMTLSNALGKLSDIGNRGVQEGFWFQFVCLLEFWRKDDSEGAERTDIAIEKSVRAAIDLIEAAPVRSVFDLGKFIWKERFGPI